MFELWSVNYGVWVVKLQSKEDMRQTIRNQYNQIQVAQSLIVLPVKYHTWPKTPYGKVTKTQEKSHTREPRGQPFPSRWPKDHKEQTSQYDHKKNPQKKHRIWTLSTNILEGLNMFDGTNLTLISDVNQDK